MSEPFCRVTAGRLDAAETAALVIALMTVASRRRHETAPRVRPARWKPVVRPDACSWQRPRGGWADAA